MSRERTEPYKEDSTDGSSIVNPLNYKGDVLVQVWIDSRILATLANWLEKNGTYPRFMSQVVRRPLELLTANLVDNEDVELVDDTASARLLLESRFQVDLNRGGRGGKNVLHNKILSDRRIEASERVGRFNDVQKPMSDRGTKRDHPDKYIPLEGYVPEYYYLEGSEESKQNLIKLLKARGIKSVKEQTDEAIASAKDSGILAKE